MERQQAIQLIRASYNEYLRPDSSKKGYICPICGSGSGNKGTGITTKDKIHFTCWAGCFTNADIIDIYALEHGLSGFNDALQEMCKGMNIELERDSQYTSPAASAAKMEALKQQEQQAQNTDYVNYYKSITGNIDKCDYLDKRGISKETQKRFMIGYDPGWKSPTVLKKGKNPPPTPRIIIPTSTQSYLARDTRKCLDDNQKLYAKMKEGKVSMFNSKVLENQNSSLFVVEGEIDALSIIECGYQAIGLGSTSNRNKFIEKVLNTGLKPKILIAMDKDEAGKKAAGELKKSLEEKGLTCYIVDISGDCKDANEMLIKDRKQFEKYLEIANDPEKLEREEYMKNSALSRLNDLRKAADTPYIPTGYEKLDKVLGGGLFEGLHIIGAISSLGKTTFTLQMADQIAQRGTDVLIFSLEMSAEELMAKSISRTTAEIVIEKGLNIDIAKSTRAITTKAFYSKYTDEEKQIIDESYDKYSEYCGNIYIIEGVGDISPKTIREGVSRHISITKRKPVIIIDYIQVMATNKGTNVTSDKQKTDENMLELKRISREYKLVVFGISSFNRDNYKEKVTMASFKESGAIEYSSDVLIGLQLYGAGEKGFDADIEKRREPRQIELVILKSRNGILGKNIKYEYKPKYNLFSETEITFFREDKEGEGKKAFEKNTRTVKASDRAKSKNEDKGIAKCDTPEEKQERFNFE